MIEILKREERNTGRQYNLDLLKAIAVIAMILCHPLMRFSTYIAGFENDPAYIIGVVILGDYVAVAHAFMFCMGVGMVYSRKNTPKDLLKRGLRLYIFAYVLNFFRYSVYILGEYLIAGTLRSEFWISLYQQDILQFAGIAMSVTALLKKLKINNFQIAIISVVMSVLGSALAFTPTGTVAGNLFFGSFFITTPTESCFTLFHWYIFVALGMLFGDIIRRIENLDRFYHHTMIVSAGVMTVYIILMVIFGFHFLSREKFYYAVSVTEALGLLSIDLFLASVCHFAVKAVGKEKLAVPVHMSRNVNSIYVIHWCIIGFTECVVFVSLGFVFPYWLSYLYGFVLIAVSYGLSVLWQKKREPRASLA